MNDSAFHVHTHIENTLKEVINIQQTHVGVAFKCYIRPLCLPSVCAYTCVLSRVSHSSVE